MPDTPTPTPIATLLETPALFRAWLASLPGDTPMRDSSRDADRCATCPIARFLRAHGWPEASFNGSSAYTSRFGRSVLAPDWCHNFVMHADGNWNADTAAGALAILDEVCQA